MFLSFTVYNLRPPSRAPPQQKKSAELQDESHRRKEGEEGLLETKGIEMSSNRRTHSASVGRLHYGSIEEQPSTPPKSRLP